MDAAATIHVRTNTHTLTYTHTRAHTTLSHQKTMDFTEDPFKDYRYEDPFNIEDPFADVADSKNVQRPTSVAGFETDDFFASSSHVNGNFTLPEKRSGRVSAPPIAYDPFSKPQYKSKLKPETSNNNDSWAVWPNDNWATEDAWDKPSSQTSDAWSKPSNQSKSNDAWFSDNSKNQNNTSDDNWKTDKMDNWANKSDNWATDWSSDLNKNLNETWPTNTLPAKKEKSPKPVKYAKSLVHTIGGIGRARHNKDKKNKSAGLEAKNVEAKNIETLPTEEQQWAWAAAESRRLEAEAENRRRREDAELQLALAISRQEK